jgi:hypothetical protein
MKATLLSPLLLPGVLISAALVTAPSAAQQSPERATGTSVRSGPLQSAGPRPDISAIEPDSPDNPRMATLACRKGQSLDLSIGTPGWKLKMPDGSLSPIVPLSSPSWPLLTGAPWQGPPNGSSTGFPVGYYTYALKVMFEPCKGPAAVVDVKYMSDNRAKLLLDGVVVQQQAGTPYYGFLPGSLSSFHQVLLATVSGIHTITVEVENRTGPNKPYSTPTGVSAHIVLSR